MMITSLIIDMGACYLNRVTHAVPMLLLSPGDPPDGSYLTYCSHGNTGTHTHTYCMKLQYIRLGYLD